MTSTMSPSGVVVPVTDATYPHLVFTRREPILLAFMDYGDSTCQALQPVLDQLAHDREGTLVVATIDITPNPTIAETWGITEPPVMLLLHGSVLQRVFLGVRPYARLVQEIDEMDLPDTPAAAPVPHIDDEPGSPPSELPL
ncbi:MAG TPA: thioredoxin domain-containing protein [Candidatus Limnocylindrales bacterium]|nr:thioredoxin domain-containing protein [Candidatus Limnocylindrales bacterium]